MSTVGTGASDRTRSTRRETETETVDRSGSGQAVFSRIRSSKRSSFHRRRRNWHRQRGIRDFDDRLERKRRTQTSMSPRLRNGRLYRFDHPLTDGRDVLFALSTTEQPLDAGLGADDLVRANGAGNAGKANPPRSCVGLSSNVSTSCRAGANVEVYAKRGALVEFSVGAGRKTSSPRPRPAAGRGG
jgi:hypothetical protein